MRTAVYTGGGLLRLRPADPPAGPGQRHLPAAGGGGPGREPTQAVANEASEGIQVLASYTMKEAQIENLVTAKGYTDCVAFMGEDSISVVVATDTGELTGRGRGQDHGHRHDGDRIPRQRHQDHGRQISMLYFPGKHGKITP